MEMIENFLPFGILGIMADLCIKSDTGRNHKTSVGISRSIDFHILNNITSGFKCHFTDIDGTDSIPFQDGLSLFHRIFGYMQAADQIIT